MGGAIDHLVLVEVCVNRPEHPELPKKKMIIFFLPVCIQVAHTGTKKKDRFLLNASVKSEEYTSYRT